MSGALWIAGLACAKGQGASERTVQLQIGDKAVTAEVADTPDARAQGLQGRKELPADHGMLFVYPDEHFRSFWMKDTFIPLDIAYLDAELSIVDILPMEPQSENTYPSTQPAMFALEVPMGWFAQKGIAVGAQAIVVFGPGGS